MLEEVAKCQERIFRNDMSSTHNFGEKIQNMQIDIFLKSIDGEICFCAELFLQLKYFYEPVR